jgi:hypothetical protein
LVLSNRAKIRGLAPGVCSLFRLPTPSGKLPRMKPLQEGRTPTQLLWIIAASNALVSIGFAIPYLQSWQRHRVPLSQNLPWFAVILVGLIATLLSEAALKEGVASKQWPEALLVTPRKLLEHSAIPVLGWSLIVASFAAIAFAHGNHIGGAWAFLAPSMGLNRVRVSLRPPGKVATNPRLLPYPAKPLLSEHWGSPPKLFSD